MTPKQMEQAVRVCLEWVAHDDLDTLRNDVLKAKAILKEIEEAPDEPKNPTCRECNNIEKIPSAFPNYRCKVRQYVVTPDERRNMLCSSFEPIVPAEPLEKQLAEALARAEKAEGELKKATDKIHRVDDELNQAFDKVDKAKWVRNTAQFARNEAVARAEKAEKQRDKLATTLSETLALGNDAVAEADVTNDRSQKQIKKLNSDHDAALKRAEKAEKYLAIVQDAIRRIPS